MKYIHFIGLFLLLSACTAPPEAPDYLANGKTIQAATFSALSSKLQQEMAAGGVSGAVQYCRLAAYPLVDSLSKVYQATIRRTSLKVRNPLDAPTESERVQLNSYQQLHQNGQPLEALIQPISETEIAYYAPILVNDLCLKCHGQPDETLRAVDYAKIQELYPGDKATGYVAGDLRGMWSITFFKDNE
ncbi:MAG: DUF3365 domain-containing protein [Saprospiraceae bacterium]|nr:DUF3365 domain-containing protein [Saprospiraceae bacterium]